MAMIRKSLPGATMIDALCAIVLISISFSIGLAIIQNTMVTRNNLMQETAWVKAGEKMDEVAQNSQLVELSEFTENPFTIVVTVKAYQDFKKTYVITASVLKANKKVLLVRRKVVRHE